jgi:hypothetical protein
LSPASVRGSLNDGPRSFRLVVGVCLALTSIPASSVGIVNALMHPRAPASAWILALPSSWLLGLYEVIVGHLTTPYQSGDLLGQLALRAVMALVGMGAVAVLANVLAARRVLAAPLSSASRFRWNLTPVKTLVASVCGRTPDERAVASFALTSLSRVERQRLTLGAGIGIACAMSLSAASTWRTWMAAPRPPAALLALSMTLMVVWLAALRVAFSLPADLKAAWLFDLRRPDPPAIRSVVERLLLAVGVLPAALGGAVLVSHWNLPDALTHAELSVAFGWFVVEILMGPAGTVPGTQPWRPERAKLRARWPLYLAAFIWIEQGFLLPNPIGGRAFAPEPALLESPVTAIAIVAGLAIGIWAIRKRAITLARDAPTEDEVEHVLVTVRLT